MDISILTEVAEISGGHLLQSTRKNRADWLILGQDPRHLYYSQSSIPVTKHVGNNL